ncbi:MAG: patatin-like phospholipase family protein, partial [Acidobacteria bacterium]|nr:patatin-like phospholipase family protein [Candidatus Sulfomarinibacter kjeldsenii]
MKISRIRSVTIALLALILAVPAASEESAEDGPKLVLVLSGGGARGVA